ASRSEFDRAGISVVGLNEDDVESHRSFCEKFGFTIDLLADTKAQLLTALGVTKSEWGGTMYWDRTTVVVDPNGVVRKVYTDVKPDGHAREVLQDIRSLQVT